MQCYRGAIIRLQPAWRHRWPARVKPPAGPPWSVTDDDRRQRAKQYWPPTLRVGGPVINNLGISVCFQNSQYTLYFKIHLFLQTTQYWEQHNEIHNEIFATMFDNSTMTAAIIICSCQVRTNMFHNHNIMDKQWTVFWPTHLLLHTLVHDNMTKPKCW